MCVCVCVCVYLSLMSLLAKETTTGKINIPINIHAYTDQHFQTFDSKYISNRTVLYTMFFHS